MLSSSRERRFTCMYEPKLDQAPETFVIRVQREDDRKPPTPPMHGNSKREKFLNPLPPDDTGFKAFKFKRGPDILWNKDGRRTFVMHPTRAQAMAEAAGARALPV